MEKYLELKTVEKVVGWVVKTFIVTTTAVLTVKLWAGNDREDSITVNVNLCGKSEDAD